MLDSFHMLTSVSKNLCSRHKELVQLLSTSQLTFLVDLSCQSFDFQRWNLPCKSAQFFVATSLQFVVLMFNMTILRFFPKDPPRLCECLTIPDKLGLHFSQLSQFQVPQVCLEAILAWRSSPACWACGCDLWACGCDLWACGCDLVLLLFGGWFHPLSKQGNKMTMDQNSPWGSIIWSHTPADYHTLLLLHVLNIPPTSRW